MIGGVPSIKLSDQIPLTKGGERAIYADPTDDARVIKVMLPEDGRTHGGIARRFFAKVFKGHRRFLLTREYHEHLRLCLNVPEMSELPVVHTLGVVLTDLGVGFVNQRIVDAQGQLAPTWHAVAQAGAVDDVTIDAMTVFARRVLACGVRCSDLTARNVVIGHRRLADQTGPLEAVLIDGLGDTHAIPVRTWSKRINRSAVERRFERLAKVASLVWDAEGQAFRRP